ncbi:uncharacterized protein LOC106648243 [Trichogramma pretiosum]|uniref:uncharacterized protein LOC106648243 n=1 Tax=Trichogramma pretiosum TaxID=7493 RepID=UPI0006C99009|nr:uncharacterized protein LOC106648243 [Trichogramma pretiosum]
MQGNRFTSDEESGPRCTSKQASQFHIVPPTPTVPEVSLILEKPRPPLPSVNDTLSRSVPEAKANIANFSSIRGSESYAAWREKQFPQQFNRTSPNGYNRVFSSTQNSTHLQNSHSPTHHQHIKNNSEVLHEHNFKQPSPNSHKRLSESEKAKKIDSIINKYSAKNNQQDHLVHNNHLHDNNDEYRRKVHYADENIPNGREPPAHSQTIDACDVGYRYNIQRSHQNPHIDTYHHRSMPVGHDGYLTQSRSLQPVHYNTECHQRSCNCCNSHNSHNNSSGETDTVKHLLTIITSQNEQIKSLQKQVERLLKLHEQSLKTMKHCTCQPNGIFYQNHTYDQSKATNFIKSNEQVFSDLKLKENDKTKQQAILEQKVSIGVMTSFELKVQNNQAINKDKDTKQKIAYENALPNVPQTSEIIKNLVNDTGEMIKKKSQTFNPYALDNISEASESHLSSFRQNHSSADQRQFEENHESLEVQTGQAYEETTRDCELKNSDSRFNVKEVTNKNDDRLTKEQYAMDKTREKLKAQERERQYNAQYENRRFEPIRADGRASPFEERRASPYGKPISPHEDRRNYEDHRASPYEEHRTSPYEEQQHQYRAQKQPVFEEKPRDDNFTTPYENRRARHPPRSSAKRAPFYDNKPVNAIERPMPTDFRKMKNNRADHVAEECLSLSSSELDVEEPSPPSPEPSIHVDMQEFSSEGGSLPPQRSSKPGCTLYDNVLYQVNQILQNSKPLNDDDDDDDDDQSDDMDNNLPKGNVIMDTVKAATMEQLAKLGISFCENVDQRDPNFNKQVLFDAAYYASQGHDAHMAATSIETNTSMHMKALAMKYLNEEQLVDMQKQRVNVMKQAPASIQNSNMSFATMHYLQRYQLLPGGKEPPKDHYKTPRKNVHERVTNARRRAPSPQRYPQAYAANPKVSFPSKILDMSTLKQQSKLL